MGVYVPASRIDRENAKVNIIKFWTGVVSPCAFCWCFLLAADRARRREEPIGGLGWCVRACVRSVLHAKAKIIQESAISESLHQSLPRAFRPPSGGYRNDGGQCFSSGPTRGWSGLPDKKSLSQPRHSKEWPADSLGSGGA